MESAGMGDGKYKRASGLNVTKYKKKIDMPRMIVYNYTRQTIYKK